MLSRKIFSWGALGLVWAVSVGAAPAQAPITSGTCVNGACATGACYGQECFTCQHTHCPPALKHCTEGPPHICFKCGCPRPICNPCMNPNWGYFETCWNPWPWPPDYSHCRAVPPAAMITLNPGMPAVIGAPSNMPTMPDGTLPSPRTLRPGL